MTNITKIKQAMSKKFNIPVKDLVHLENQSFSVVLDGRQASDYKGSWNDIMSAPAKDYEIEVDKLKYDARKGMTWAVYKAFQDSSLYKVDKGTCTWLTGEADKLPDWTRHFWGVPCVPVGDCNNGQLGSDLHYADGQGGDMRPRLAVIITKEKS